MTLAGGAEHEADVLISATGQLSRPEPPDIPGLDRFEGTLFHSARWDHDHDLTGERVAVLGTGERHPVRAGHRAGRGEPRGVPALGAQRARQARPGDRRRAKSAFARVPGLLRVSREGNYFSNELRSLGFNTEPRLRRARPGTAAPSREVLPNPALRAKLTPTDPMGCKRILMSNDWYQARRLPQVRCVTDGIAKVRPRLDPDHRRHRAPGRRHRAGHRLRGDGVPRASDHRAGRAGLARAVEGQCECYLAPSSRGSRTCSCSTARTPTWARLDPGDARGAGRLGRPGRARDRGWRARAGGGGLRRLGAGAWARTVFAGGCRTGT